MNRRGFLQAVLAAGVAPAFVRYGSLMVPRAFSTLTLPAAKTLALLTLTDELLLASGLNVEELVRRDLGERMAWYVDGSMVNDEFTGRG